MLILIDADCAEHALEKSIWYGRRSWRTKIDARKRQQMWRATKSGFRDVYVSEAKPKHRQEPEEFN